MTKTPTPASHAVNTAPISAGLRGIDQEAAPTDAMIEAFISAANQYPACGPDESWMNHAYGKCRAGLSAALASQPPAAQPSRECLQQSAEHAAALRSAIAPLINAYGEAQWQSGRGVPHPDLEQAFEAIIAAALQAAPPAPAGVAVPAAIDPSQCAQDVFAAGLSIGLFDIPKDTANAICAGIAAATGARVDWHYIAGRVHMKALAAAPAQAVAVTDDMALAFHRAISDGSIGQEDVDEIKAGLRAALCNVTPAQEHATQLAGQGPDVCPVLDYDWKLSMLDGRALVRDDMGLGEHPDLPLLEEGSKPKQFFDALGIELAAVMAEDQMDMYAYEAMVEDSDYTVWTPGAPEGEGWALVAIFDTEDGPAAWWMREAAAPVQAQEDAQDAVRALIATHAEMLEDNAYAYFELAYTRQTGWMAWITDKPFSGPVLNPDRKVLAKGQGDTPDEACADAARAAQGGA